MNEFSPSTCRSFGSDHGHRNLRRAKPLEKGVRNTKFVRKESKFSFGSSLLSSEPSKDSLSKYTISLDSIGSGPRIANPKDKCTRSVMPMLEPFDSSERYNYSSKTSSFYSSNSVKNSLEDGVGMSTDSFENFNLKPIFFSPLRIWDKEKNCFVNQAPRSKSEHRKFYRSRSGSNKRSTVGSVTRKVERLTSLIGKIKKEIDVHEKSKKKNEKIKRTTTRSKSLDSRQFLKYSPNETDDSAQTIPKTQSTEKTKANWKEFHENFSSLVRFMKPKTKSLKKNSITSLSTDLENELTHLAVLCSKQNTQEFTKISDSSCTSSLTDKTTSGSSDVFSEFSKIKIENSDSALERTFNSSQVVTTSECTETTSTSDISENNQTFTEKQQFRNLPSTSEDDDRSVEKLLKISSAFNPNLRKVHLDFTNHKKCLENERREEKNLLSEKLLIQRSESLAQQKQFRSNDIFKDPSFARHDEILIVGTGKDKLSRFISLGVNAPTVTFV